MSGSAGNITEFIEAKNYPPAAVIVPDTIYIDGMTTHHYARFYRAKIYFKTLDGELHDCRTDNYNSSTAFRIWINNNEHNNYLLIEKPNDRGLFTFDARIRMYNGEILDYAYISYPYDGWEEETLTTSIIFSLDRYSSADTVNTKINGKYPVFHIFSLSEELSSALEFAGFNTEFSKNEDLFDSSIVSNNIRNMEWKFRSRIDRENYFTASYNTKFNDDVIYCSSTYDTTSYSNSVSECVDLYNLDAWIDDVFPGWT